MRSSKWHALGNSYLVLDTAELTASDVRRLVGDADGIVQVLSCGDDWADVVIWNPDGSTAEMSGNGTRIAARWLAERNGVDEVSIRVGPREVRARMLEGADVEQDLGRVEVGRQETVEGVELVLRTRRYAAYQRKWMRRIPGIAMVDADRPAGEVADEIVEMARARQFVPGPRHR